MQDLRFSFQEDINYDGMGLDCLGISHFSIQYK